ncbi:Aminoglycoside phosphotransferase [Penicillium argentinense]|uniref:Aminoglycoside phosphotransferase n=1 Tax=Penicillium argentinense TaxID=1131581 RepID=A0A9W9KFU9_9EURO|nr:Aminoglycoside phosphotransferase [Penicillium argentinense]KAJ5104113.1 Aminoglycoside phosphotransferase [Penicillium argentinense]
MRRSNMRTLAHTHPTLVPLKAPNMVSTHKTIQPPELDEYQRLDAILSLLYPSTVNLQRSQVIFGHIHSLRLLTLSNGARLLLKTSPVAGTPLLRHERFFLETEARFLALLGQSANPCVPQLYHYDPEGSLLGSAYLVRQYVKGTSLLELQSRITPEQRNDVDRHLGFLASTIAQNVAPAFGSLQQVAVRAGKRSWRDAFCALFESVLRDAEDMFINLPYAEIRDEMSRLESALEEVMFPRLVVVGFGRPSHVLLDERSKQLSGVVDFSSALWGDILMAEIFESPAPAVLEGAGMPLGRTKGEDIRLLMYSAYRLVSQITVQYYRNLDEPKEFDARRRLTATIAKMGAMDPV